jgi:hypothetical protein
VEVKAPKSRDGLESELMRISEGRMEDTASGSVDIARMGEILQEVKELAKAYKELTKKPLGITGEVAEYEAARLLDLRLCDARQPGYDAVRLEGGVATRIQIKGRCSTDHKSGQRVGSIRFKHAWDLVVLVFMDDNFEPLEIYEAERDQIRKRLEAPGSAARNERGSLAVSQFKSIARKVWPE